MRFAKMQSYTGLITILKKYRIELVEGTPQKLNFKPHAFVLTPSTAINIKFIERDGWENRMYKRD